MTDYSSPERALRLRQRLRVIAKDRTRNVDGTVLHRRKSHRRRRRRSRRCRRRRHRRRRRRRRSTVGR